MHLDDEQLQRLLHGELEQRVAAAVRQHVVECAECRERVAAAQRDEDEVYALLRRVDHAAPRIDARAVAARARAYGWSASWLRWAAGIVLALGLAGAAYAIPGLPLRAWVQRVVGGIVPTPAQAPDSGLAGIAVAPGPDLLLAFTAHQTGGEAEVALTDGREVVVRALTGAARFTTASGRLVIDNRGEGSTDRFEIQIPRTAPRVEIVVGDASVFLKVGDRLPAGSCRSVTPLRWVCPLRQN